MLAGNHFPTMALTGPVEAERAPGAGSSQMILQWPLGFGDHASRLWRRVCPDYAMPAQWKGVTMHIVLVLAGVLLAAILAFGLFSRRRSIPCPVWLRWCVELDNPFARTNRAAFIVEHLDLRPGMSALDAGCGPGRLTMPLARRVGEHGEVLAVDIQPGMLERARQKAQAGNLENIRFLQAGLGEGKLDRCRFDRAVLVTVLGEIPNRERALQEIFDSLKPGGILSITETLFDPHFQSRPHVTRMTKSAGFREKAFFGNRIAYTLHVEKPGGR